MAELLQDLGAFLRTLHWAWLFATVAGGIVLLQFGYRIFETLKFLVGFAVGGTLIGSFLYADKGLAAAAAGFLAGGAVSGFIFRGLVNAIPPLIGGLVLGLPTFLFFEKLAPGWLPPLPDPMPDWRSIAVLLAAIAGGAIGRLLSQVITVVGTAFLGAMLIATSVAKIHVELGGFATKPMTEPSTYVGWLAAYAVGFLALLFIGIRSQFKWIVRQRTVNGAA